MKLETLKDIKCNILYIDTDLSVDKLCDCKGINQIRQAAIKWIKYVRKNCIYACRHGMVCKEHRFWMERFNITDDDLK